MATEPGNGIDLRLVAYLDGELDEAERRALEKELAENPALKADLDRLAEGGLGSLAGHDILLAAAPAARLEAILASAEAEVTKRDSGWRGRRGLFAAFAAAILLLVGGLAGYGLSELTNRGEHAAPPNWRAVVAEYVALYTPETFAPFPSDPAIHAPGLAMVGKELGLDLAPDKVALPDFDLKGAILFRFRDMPLAQIAYLSPKYGPAEFCIIVNGRPDAPPQFEQREGKNIVYWTKGGRGYLVIGDLPRPMLESMASALSGRIS